MRTFAFQCICKFISRVNEFIYVFQIITILTYELGGNRANKAHYEKFDTFAKNKGNFRIIHIRFLSSFDRKIIPENRNKYKPYHIKCNKNTGGQEDDCRNNEQQWLHLPYLR